MTFPTAIDSFTNPVAGDATNSGTVPHATQHSQVNTAINAIETTLMTRQAAPTVASGTTIAPSKYIVFVSGVTPVVTITPPTPIATQGGAITIIPTGVFVTTTAGNIALASTTVVGKALIMTYDPTTTKWYPSY